MDVSERRKAIQAVFFLFVALHEGFLGSTLSLGNANGNSGLALHMTDTTVNRTLDHLRFVPPSGRETEHESKTLEIRFDSCANGLSLEIYIPLLFWLWTGNFIHSI